MIRILEQGTRKIAYCEDCGCKFSYESEDIQRTMTEYFGNTTGIKSFVLCPQCHREKVLERIK